MKRLVLLVLLICWIFDDVKSKNVEKKESSASKLRITLEKILNANLTQLEVVISGGNMNNGYFYKTDKNKLLFVKENSKPGTEKMFHGEYEGLKALNETQTVPIPNVIAIGHTPDKKSHFIIMDYIKLVDLSNACSAELGYRIGQLHLYNSMPENLRSAKTIKKFGFHVDTGNGFILQNNTWTDDWITFFTVNRMDYNIKLLESSPGNIDLKELIIEKYWPQLKKIIPKFFEGIKIKPSLLHGDLWLGNTDESEYSPVVFDPAAFYGHHEYDIALFNLFGGHLECLIDEYYKVVPKAKGFDNRELLYQTYHYLNHWIQFGKDYQRRTVEYFEKVLKVFK